MKIAFVSDTHMHLAESWGVPECDLLIHTGDFSFQGTLQEMTKFVVQMNKIPAKHKILVPGNHDRGFELQPQLFEDMCRQNGIIPLSHGYLELEGLKIFGTSYQPEFCGWAFNVWDSLDLAEYYEDIPNGLDILATHCPPYGMLDHCSSGHVGSPELLRRVEKVRPKIHAFGHIHEGYGTKHARNIDFVNASICDGMYRAVNSAIIIDL